MPDPADLAHVQEEAFRAASLARAKATPGPAPCIAGGVVCCALCALPIPQARLDALPGVGLCVGCQEDAEQEWFA